MPRFTSEIMPPQYNPEVLQRELENIHKQLGNVESMTDGEFNKIRNRIMEMQDELSNTSSFVRENRAGQQSVMPYIDSDLLTVNKWIPLPFVHTWYKKPLEIIKYPHVAGFQFFASPEKDFIPIMELSGQTVTLEGTCDCAHATDLYVSAVVSDVPGLGASYKDLPFWSDMSLSGKGIMNTTTGLTGTITTWVATNPLVCQGTGIAWSEGDGYRIFNVPRPRNLIGQGPLPFAIKVISASFNTSNPYWDGKSYYVKCRTYSTGLPRSRRYGQLTQASSTSLDAGLPAPTVTASPFYYANYIYVRWTPNWDYVGQGFHNLDYWKVYRTTVNDSTLCTDDTYVVADNRKVLFFTDWGYNATTNPNGPQPGTTYYYWVRAVDKDGTYGRLSEPDNALLGIAADPVIDSITEESTNSLGRTKNYDVTWHCVGAAEGYKIKYRRKLNGTYGLYSLPVLVNHTTEFGVDGGGNDIQKFTLTWLQVRQTYTVAIQAVQNWQILGLNSNWVTQDFTVGDTGNPQPPT